MKNYIAGGMIAVALLIFWGVDQDSPTDKNSAPGRAELSSTSRKAQVSAYDEKVNKHLFQTQTKQDLKAAQMQAENTMTAPDLNEIKPSVRPQQNQYGVQMQGDAWDDHIVNQFEKNQESDFYKPDYQVQLEMYENQMAQEYDQKYRDEYKKQFIENARKAGYQVKLGADNRVLSVKPLKKPASIQDFRVIESGQGAVR